MMQMPGIFHWLVAMTLAVGSHVALLSLLDFDSSGPGPAARAASIVFTTGVGSDAYQPSPDSSAWLDASETMVAEQPREISTSASAAELSPAAPVEAESPGRAELTPIEVLRIEPVSRNGNTVVTLQPDKPQAPLRATHASAPVTQAAVQESTSESVEASIAKAASHPDPVAAVETEQGPTVVSGVTTESPTAERVVAAAAVGSVQAPAQGQGASSDAARQSYYSTLKNWLERYKRYPRQAMLRRQQGVVTVRLRINRVGDVLDFSIVEGSGYPLLDREARRMVQRATPLPPLPDAITTAELSEDVAIQFRP